MDQKLAYFSTFHFYAFKSIMNRQKLIIPEPIHKSTTLLNRISCYYDFKITKKYRNEWKELMQIGPDDTFVPFTYHWPWTIKGLMESLLPGLGLNLKNYLHVGQKVKYLADYSMDSKTRYTNWNALVDLCPIGNNKMAIISESSVYGPSGKTIVQTTDYSLVSDMTPDEIKALSTLPYCNLSDVSMLKNKLSKKKREIVGALCKYRETFYCHDSMGIRFGCVSGALNTTHTFKTISPLFGHKKPFLQGMCTGNIIISLICMRFEKKINELEVFFSNKLYVPQKVELCFNDEKFELIDEAGKVVAFGKYRLEE